MLAVAPANSAYTALYRNLPSGRFAGFAETSLRVASLVFVMQTRRILARLGIKYLKFELKFEINSSQQKPPKKEIYERDGGP